MGISDEERKRMEDEWRAEIAARREQKSDSLSEEAQAKTEDTPKPVNNTEIRPTTSEPNSSKSAAYSSGGFQDENYSHYDPTETVQTYLRLVGGIFLTCSIIAAIIVIVNFSPDKKGVSAIGVALGISSVLSGAFVHSVTLGIATILERMNADKQNARN